MLKAILLLNPVYVTVFWSIIFNIDRKQSSAAKRVLGKFMIFASIIYISHLIFYLPIKQLYLYIDPVYQFSSLIVIPIYYVYLRLLTIDESFSWTRHRIYFFTPSLLTTLYLIGILASNPEELAIWIFNRNSEFESFGLKYLKFIYFLMRASFVIQVIYMEINSLNLLKQFKNKAEQFYSDMDNAKSNNVAKLNFMVMLASGISIVSAILGRDFFQDEIIGIAITSIAFSAMLFTIGLLGIKQKTVPSVNNISCECVRNETAKTGDEQSQKLLEKILHLFEDEKIYLNENLNIVDLANMTGSNRTYISHIINHYYHQNFCTFVNSFRVEEVKKCILENSGYTNSILADKCGFSSTDSLKRVVKNLSGMSVTELKSNLIKD